MKFPELIEGVLVRRYKRFFADVELGGGEVVVSHCANPGAMTGCLPVRGRVWLSESARPRRRLRWTWELVEADGGALVCVNTARANQVVAEALSKRRVAELAGWSAPRREVRYGQRSRVDFLLQRGERLCYLEVKSVTLGRGRAAAFPDSVTARGARHLEELIGVVRAGHRAVLLFCVGRTRASAVRPADDIDPVYGETLRRAAAAGVEVLAYRCRMSPRSMSLAGRVPVEL